LPESPWGFFPEHPGYHDAQFAWKAAMNPKGKRKIYILVGVAVLIAAGAAIYYFYFVRPPQEKAEIMPPQHSAAEVVHPRTAVEPIVEPIDVELDESDGLVRKLAESLSSNPGFARWLVPDNLIRRFVSIVVVVAKGLSPRRDINFIELKEPFQVSEAGGKTFLDPKSYQRYKRITDIFVSLDTEGCVKLYRQLRLPIQKAYRDLGYPGEDFDVSLKKAIQVLLETPIVERRIYLDRSVLTYTFADPELEELSPAQKHLLRMGPENMRAIQAKLQEIEKTLGFLN
jgi:hypothetical protein